MYILQRSLISMGAVGSSFSKAARRLLEFALLQQLHGGLVVLESGSRGRGGVAAGLGGSGGVFLRLGAADRASCVMGLPGARLPERPIEPDAAG